MRLQALTVGRSSSYQLAQVRTGQSLTHDMATGLSRTGTGSGYVFDEGVPLDLQRYTTRGSERSFGGARRAAAQQTTPRRAGSISTKLNRAFLPCLFPSERS